tara:strand:- start:1549 stop:3576 length:2028 start_codon:yes stop_codon:yes gene_type:complete
MSKPKKAAKTSNTGRKPAKKSAKKMTSTASKKDQGDTTPFMAYESTANITTNYTSTRRNKAATINRTDKYANISNGLVPFKYSYEYGDSGTKSLDVRDAVILCQKAYYNFSQFRNVIDLMTEFSLGNIYFRGASKKSRAFFEALFNKLNIWDFQDQFFREYYRSGNVFVYRFDATLSNQEVSKITQTFGSNLSSTLSSTNKIPSSYMLVNPADIRMTGTLAFNNPVYYKLVTNYELERLKTRKTEEDKQMFDSLPKNIQKQIDTTRSAAVQIPLDVDRIKAVFYKKQDYEPFAVPMGYPVLADISFKDELKKMDMAIGRCMQQAILLVTMGTDPEKGGINQRNLQAMQELFQNESVGRVLIADYTTKAEFVVPKIAELMDPKKYEIFDRDINNGLNNILVGGEKFANQESKVKVFVSRLNQGRQAFLNNFIIPEIKRISKNLGFKNYPIPYFDEMSLQDSVLKDRVYSRLLELGILTPEETLTAINTGRLPDKESSLENQREYMKQRNEGLYTPLVGGSPLAQTIKVEETSDKKKSQTPPKEAGRPDGTSGIPQENRKVSPVGQGENSQAYSLDKVKDNMILAQKLESSVSSELRKTHKVKRLNKTQKEVAIQISETIIANETPDQWEKSIKKYCKKPVDHNSERVEFVRQIADKHQLDFYLASILASSLKIEEK